MGYGIDDSALFISAAHIMIVIGFNYHVTFGGKSLHRMNARFQMRCANQDIESQSFLLKEMIDPGDVSKFVQRVTAQGQFVDFPLRGI